VALLAFGSMVAPCAEAAETLDATLANMRFVKPLDLDLVMGLARGHDLLVTVEENAIAGGAGSAVAEALSGAGLTTRCIHLGLPDRYIDHAAHEEQLAACGLDPAGIDAAVRSALTQPCTQTPAAADLEAHPA
jgi:1-deoxy-D-xylulose-5-phosphate synthase